MENLTNFGMSTYPTAQGTINTFSPRDESRPTTDVMDIDTSADNIYNKPFRMPKPKKLDF